MPATIFEDSDLAKVLRNSINLNDQAKILTGSDDPTAVAKDAPRGSIYMRTGGSGGEVYRKTDDGSSTSWVVIASGTTGPAQSIAYQLDVLDSSIRAGEEISANDAVALVQFSEDGFLVMKAESDSPRFAKSFIGFAKSAATVTQGHYTLTLDDSLITGNNVSFDLNGDPISVDFSSSSDETLQAIADAISAHPSVDTADTDSVQVGANKTGSDDRVINIYSGNGRGSDGAITILIDNISVTGGVSQAGLVFATTTTASGDSVDIHRLGHLGLFSGLTPNKRYWLSSTAGGITDTLPTTEAVSVGFSTSATELLVEPQEPIVPALLFALVRSHGTSNAHANGSETPENNVEVFNYTSWGTGVASATSVGYCQQGDAAFNGNHHVVDGSDGTAAQSFHARYNKSSWTTGLSTTSAARHSGGITEASGYLYQGMGSYAEDGSNGNEDLEQYNGSSWTKVADTGMADISSVGCFKIGSDPHFFGGAINTGTTVNTHYSWDGSSIQTETVYPTSNSSCGSAASSGGNGVGTHNNTTNMYEWNGSSWGSATATSYTFSTDSNDRNGVHIGAAGGFDADGYTFHNGGASSDTVSVKSTNRYNGSSHTASVDSSTTRSGGGGSVI